MFRIVIVILFLNFLSGKLNGQDIIKTYKNLSLIEKRWVLLHPLRAIKIKKITQLARQQTINVKQSGRIDTLNHGGQLDAFRHAYWMALIAQKTNNKKAIAFGEIHEKGNYEQFLKNQTEDRELQDSISCLMDLKNNEVGAKIKMNFKPNYEELTDLILKKITNGELFILKYNNDQHFVNCNNEVIEKPPIKFKKWHLDYCLVSSNQIPQK